MARELAQVSEELETVKAEMDQRGTSMTDAAPLVKIKQALTKLKAESTQMEIRLGVVSDPVCPCMFQLPSLAGHAGRTHSVRSKPQEQVCH